MEFQSCFDLHFSDGKNVEHFFKCLSAILDSSVESSLFRSVLHFFLKLDYVIFWCPIS